jgi:hypothetical protein
MPVFCIRQTFGAVEVPDLHAEQRNPDTQPQRPSQQKRQNEHHNIRDKKPAFQGHTFASISIIPEFIVL